MRFAFDRASYTVDREEFFDGIPESWHSRITVEDEDDGWYRARPYIEIHNLEELMEFIEEVDYRVVLSEYSLTLYDDYME